MHDANSMGASFPWNAPANAAPGWYWIISVRDNIFGRGWKLQTNISVGRWSSRTRGVDEGVQGRRHPVWYRLKRMVPA